MASKRGVSSSPSVEDIAMPPSSTDPDEVEWSGGRRGGSIDDAVVVVVVVVVGRWMASCGRRMGGEKRGDDGGGVGRLWSGDRIDGRNDDDDDDDSSDSARSGLVSSSSSGSSNAGRIRVVRANMIILNASPPWEMRRVLGGACVACGF